MSSKNPFNGDKKSGGNKAPSQKANDAARRVQQESGGNKSGIGQRKGRPAPKPGVERSGGSGAGSSGSGGKSSTTPRLPRNRPELPKSGSGDSSSSRRGCSLPFGILGVLSVVGVFALTQWL